MIPWVMLLAGIEGVDGLPTTAIPQLSNAGASSTTVAAGADTNAALTLSWRCSNVSDANYEIKIYTVDPGTSTDPLYVAPAPVLLTTLANSEAAYTYDTGVKVGETPWLFQFTFRIDVVHTVSGDVADSETITASWVG